METNIKNSLSEITTQKDDYVTFMNSEKDHYKKWYEESANQFSQLYNDSQKEYTDFLTDSQASIEQIKKTYADELKVTKPAEFMENKANAYKRSSIYWGIATIILSILLFSRLFVCMCKEQAEE